MRILCLSPHAEFAISMTRKSDFSRKVRFGSNTWFYVQKWQLTTPTNSAFSGSRPYGIGMYASAGQDWAKYGGLPKTREYLELESCLIC